jgi:hypothetical protein
MALNVDLDYLLITYRSGTQYGRKQGKREREREKKKLPL